MEASNSAHSFQPHHTIHIEYPCNDLHHRLFTAEQRAASTLVVLEPHNSANRYDPTIPLVHDPAVAAHADGRTSQDEVCVFSRTKAEVIVPTGHEGVEMVQGFIDVSERSLRALNRHIYGIQHTPDDTTLRVLVRPSAPPADPVILVERKTRVISADYNRLFTTSAYSGNATDLFGHTAAPTYEAQWLENLADLVFGESNRAVRHVAARMTAAGAWPPTGQWKAPRIPLCDIKVAQATHTPATVAGECSICQEKLDLSTAVAMPCGHQICLPGLLKWKALLSETVSRDLKYGTACKGQILDSRFSLYENLLRSFADLDHDVAEESDEPMRVDSQVLMAAFV
ncbi:hypothetical protein LTR49_027537 [Elasticomyces elasticus]|nr:hypothetical protein LTR49_027537 [Elasticomyces elasticus]